MRHTISCLVRNRFGVLAHVAGLFSSRGYNIESLTVSKTEDPMFSRMTIVTIGDDSIIEQIRKQLGKLIDIIKVIDLSDVETVERDLLLIKVNAQPGTRGEIIQLTEAYGGRIVDIGPKELLAELTGSEKKVDSFVRLMQPFGIKEIARTGRVSMARGSTTG
ncbi:MAG: acetolactate synthase small subunit [Planctomycetota bacterium]